MHHKQSMLPWLLPNTTRTRHHPKASLSTNWRSSLLSHALLAPLIVMPMFTLSGCVGPTKSRNYRMDLAKLIYPEDATYGEDLDIVLVNHGQHIELVNRTPKTYKDMQLWLNQQYVYPIHGIAIGTGQNYLLNAFTNLYEESFRPNSFRKIKSPTPVVLAEFYNPHTQLKHRISVLPN